MLLTAGPFAVVDSIKSAPNTSPISPARELVIRTARRDEEPGMPNAVVPSLEHAAVAQMSGATGSSMVSIGVRVLQGETITLHPVIHPLPENASAASEEVNKISKSIYES